MKGNCWKKNLTTCERKISSYKPAFTEAAIERCSVKKMFLEISQDSQGNTYAKASFLIKLQTLLKKRPWYICFPVNFVKILRTSFCIEYLWWLLLYIKIKIFLCKNLITITLYNPVVIFNKIDYLDKMENLLNDLQK